MAAESGEIWLLDPGEIAGGGQRFGLRLAKALRFRGFRVTVGCRADGPLGIRSRDAGIEVADMRFPALAPSGGVSIPATVTHTRRFLKGIGPTALVVGNHPRVHAYLYAATRGLGRSPAIVSLAHEQDSARRRAARFAYRRFGALLVVGANAAGEYRSRIPGVPITDANNFLPTEYFDEARRRQGAPPSGEQPMLGVLSRLIPEKGILELLEELASDRVGPRWSRLTVGGAFQDSDYMTRVTGRIEELGLADRVTLLGDVEDVPGFLGSVDFLVVPSIGKEAQPTVILEALAHGNPVVVRAALYSDDYEGLSVIPYSSAAELGAALRDPPTAAAPVKELARRFGPEQAIDALERAAQLARASR